MHVTHILEELAYDMGQLPREAIEAAIVNRVKITPYLLDILENAIERIDEIIEHDNYQAHLYAMYLLAQFREPAAYPLITRLVSFAGDIPHAVLGDILTEDLSRILASVSLGQTDLIQLLIENSSINEYVRASAQTSLVILVGSRLKEREDVLDYFHYLFEEKLEKKPSFVWDNLISCCCDLYPEEVYPQISAAFKKNLVDCTFIELSDVHETLSKRKEVHLARLMQNSELIDDTVAEMEKWLVFQEPVSILPSIEMP